MTSTVKLLLVALLAASSAAWLAYAGGSSSWQYYVTTDECLRDGAVLTGQRLRVNGHIAAESLKISDDRREAAFDLLGTEGRVRVVCPGPLPDNLAEDMDVVVEGVLESPGSLRGTSVLTRCASKYQPEAG